MPSRRPRPLPRCSRRFGERWRGRAGATWAAALRDAASGDRFWVGDGADRYLAIAVDGHGRSGRRRSAPTWATCWAPAPWTPRRSPRVAATAHRAARCSARYGIAHARPRTTAASTRSATTPVRCGPTTRRSARWGLMREGRRRGGGARGAQPAGLGRAVRLPLARALRRLRRRSAGPRRTRPPAGRRPGRPPRPRSLLSVALGFDAGRAGGPLVLRPQRPAPFGALTIRGLRFAGHEFGVRCDADGNVEVLDPPPGVTVEIG